MRSSYLRSVIRNIKRIAIIVYDTQMIKIKVDALIEASYSKLYTTETLSPWGSTLKIGGTLHEELPTKYIEKLLCRHAQKSIKIAAKIDKLLSSKLNNESIEVLHTCFTELDLVMENLKFMSESIDPDDD